MLNRRRCRETREQQWACLLNGNLFKASTFISMRSFIRCVPHRNLDWKMIFTPKSEKVTVVTAKWMQSWSAVIFWARLWNVHFMVIRVMYPLCFTSWKICSDYVIEAVFTRELDHGSVPPPLMSQEFSCPLHCLAGSLKFWQRKPKVFVKAR